MSCQSCTQVIIPEDNLPPLVPCSTATTSEPVCPDSEVSVPSQGCKLDSCLTDPKDLPFGDDLTILGRVGDRLARFTGSGYIEINNGLARVTASPTLRIRDIWAQWDANCHIGDPLPYPYATAVDGNGVLHALAGLVDSDSLQVWDHTAKQWSAISVAALKQKVNFTLPQSDHIELTGFEEVGMYDSSCGAEREMKALRGNGMVYLEKVPVNACDDPCSTEAFAYIAKVVDFPTIVGTETYKLQYSSSGLAWVQE